MRKLFVAFAATVLLAVVCDAENEPAQLIAPSPPYPEIVYAVAYEAHPDEPPFEVVPRAEWSIFQPEDTDI